MADIFICYSRKDTAAVTQWVKRLEQEGFSVWVDLTSVDGATLWTKEIVEAIDQCRVVILMLSRSSVNSHHVVKEVSLASDKQKRILPLKLEAVDVPPSMQYQLANIHFLEVYDDEERGFRAIVRSLSHHGIAAGPRPSEGVAPVSPAGKTLQPSVLAVVKTGVTKAISGLSRIWWAGLSELKALWLKAKPLLLGGTYRLWKCLALAVVVLVVLVWLGWPVRPPQVPPLREDALRLIAQTVRVRSVRKSLLKDQESTAVGSAGVFQAGKKLLLVTNSVSLNLERFRGSLGIRSYEIWITFASGEMRVVGRFADKVGGEGLAILEVDGRGLEAGRDYVLLPYRSGTEMRLEDEIVVVKSSPGPGSANIRTFQTVSGISRHDRNGEQYRVIVCQEALTDANRGGLLFKKMNGEFFWVGTNVFGAKETEARNVAIHAGDFLKMDRHWYPCDPQGASAALGALYNIKARVLNK